MGMTGNRLIAPMKTALAVTLATAMCPVATAAADEGDGAAEVLEAAANSDFSVASTDWRAWDTCEWMIDDSGCLVVRPSNAATEGYLSGVAPWNALKSSIKSIRFEGTCHVVPNSDGEFFFSSWFSRCESLRTADLSGLETSSVTNMGGLFERCTALESVNLSGLDTTNVVSMGQMFWACANLTTVDLTGLNTSNVTSMKEMFKGCGKLASVNLSGLDTSNVVKMGEMFSGCSQLNSIDLSVLSNSKVTDMGGMFQQCSKLVTVNLAGIDTSKVVDMGAMFSGCSSLKSIDLSGLDVSSVEYFDSMFGSCWSLTTVNLSGLNAPYAESMSNMFSGCSALKSIDLSGMDIRRVKSMHSMFDGCTSLRTVNLTGLDVSNVEDMTYMFHTCTSLAELDLSGMETPFLKKTAYMFEGCASLISLNISGFDTSSATNMEGMFDGCAALRKITLGDKFSFAGGGRDRMCSLAKGSSGPYIRWTSSADGQSYLPWDIPNNVAATYRLVFPDVDYSQWYGDAVTFCAEKGLISGYTSGDFGVGDSLTRAQLAAILWRNAEPEAADAYNGTATNTTGMGDVADNEWYTGAANWAVANEVVNGFGGTEFRPNDPVTAEQLATILANYADPAGAENADLSVLDGFADSGAISDWARGSVAWAKSKGIINGYDEGGVRLLKPQEEIARERVATILMNAFESGVLK